MKKKIALILVVMLSLGAFALTACTDKARELDSVELSIVGTWSNGHATYTFNADGTGTLIQYDSLGADTSEFNFYHIGEGVETDGDARGHYYKIYDYNGSRDDAVKNHGSPLVLFDRYPNKLWFIMNGVIISTDDTNTFIRQSSDTSTGNETKLDSVEKSIVGEWKYQNNGSRYTFNADGTYSIDGQNKGKFSHKGDGQDDLFGHYNIIEFNNIQWRLYDFANGVIYVTGDHKPALIKNGHSRVLHSCERIILGTWQASSSNKTQYTFYSDGTVECTSWQSNTEKYFYICSEGEHSTKGHYYVFTFPDTGMSDWRIYDDDPINAYQNGSGAKVATYV